MSFADKFENSLLLGSTPRRKCFRRLIVDRCHPGRTGRRPIHRSRTRPRDASEAGRLRPERRRVRSAGDARQGRGRVAEARRDGERGGDAQGQVERIESRMNVHISVCKKPRNAASGSMISIKSTKL